jgi:hypothetical protein
MRIRTDGKYEYRKDAVEGAAAFWDCNKTEAVIRSCEFTQRMTKNVERALEHPDMTAELAEALSTPYVELEYRIETGLSVE